MPLSRILILLGFAMTELHGQTVSKSFYNQDGIFTDSIHSYYYYVSLPGSDRGLYYFTQTSKLRLKVLIESKEEVQRTYYYPNGSIKVEGRFVGDNPVGGFNLYYPNGKRQAELYYEAPKPGSGQSQMGIINFWDSLGNQKVIDGEGFCSCNLTPFSDRLLLEHGNVRDGLREGTWEGRGILGNAHYTYREEYVLGVLKGGTQICKDSTYHYIVIDSKAVPRGGLQSFYDRIPKTIKYPLRAKRLGKEGVVFIQMVINSKGKLVDVKTMKGILKECDDEAVRAVASSPPWNPRRFRGRPVDDTLVLPVIFRLK